MAPILVPMSACTRSAALRDAEPVRPHHVVFSGVVPGSSRVEECFDYRVGHRSSAVGSETEEPVIPRGQGEAPVDTDPSKAGICMGDTGFEPVTPTV
jgi:hypothetical protein